MEENKPDVATLVMRSVLDIDGCDRFLSVVSAATVEDFSDALPLSEWAPGSSENVAAARHAIDEALSGLRILRSEVALACAQVLSEQVVESSDYWQAEIVRLIPCLVAECRRVAPGVSSPAH